MNTSNTSNETKAIPIMTVRVVAFSSFPVFILGITLNLLLIRILFTDPNFRKTTYRLIRMAAISDAIGGITFLPVIVLFWIERDYKLSAIVCKISFSSNYVSTSISTMTLALIAVDRYFVVIRPLSMFYKCHKKKFLILTQIFIWIASISIASPILVFLTAIPGKLSVCDYAVKDLSVSIYIFHLVTLTYIIPVTIIIIAYTKIIIFQRNYTRPGFWTSEQLQDDFMKRMKFNKMLIFITCCYVGIGIPHLFSTMILAAMGQTFTHASGNSAILAAVIQASVACMYAIGVLNPLVYIIFDKQIRIAMFSKLKRLFCCNC
ncbi:Neuropeptide Y receptor type 2 [Trichoplax sp. H2]|uniref:G-protein coupled receptors family 1 profile domain-containing protein n=1 Tax=Trichoplax adhaerens TaxID=10228 RepID=B3SEF9_TRIAD|nr:hypothetical protein TRIADDRAFT_62649 [Trichoplax adhaerens]EDV18885.1 hypothetical protein TRIADDRAFT_62649 [Trichoplax adhaerens]RDD36621.1 Neuropeptide Y receptor type 2 [Trichoplax sp. H2]|eukprot:XP_002118628.1 hypothetical protein TRIADDRAFT_62649 [Trichoplax adhaerens]